MFSLFKKRNEEELEVPQWASFFNPAEYGAFISAIDSYFYSKNIPYQLGERMIAAGPNDYGFTNLGLANVAQICKQFAKTEYAEIIESHFGALIKTYQFDKEFKKIADHYDQIEQYIAVRLYPDDYFPEEARKVSIQRHFSGDIFAALVFDLPDSIDSITTEYAEKWGKTLDELFETGIQNVRDKYPINISKQQFDDFFIWLVAAEHFFTPNIVFDLQNHPELIGSKGLLIGLPHRHSAIIYPIEDIRVVQVFNALIPTVHGMNLEGPGSLSNNIFWFNNGEFLNLPYEIEEGTINFSPPEEFIELLNSLGETE